MIHVSKDYDKGSASMPLPPPSSVVESKQGRIKCVEHIYLETAFDSFLATNYAVKVGNFIWGA